MSQTYRNILNIALGVLLTGVLAFSYVHGKADRKAILCKGVDVTITDSTKNKFVTEAAVLEHLNSRYSDYIGKPVCEVDICRMEAILDSMSVVKKSQVYAQKDSMIYISITQRKPVVRFQSGSEGFYADEEGFIIPLQESSILKVPIIDGYIKADDHDWIRKMTDMVTFMETSPVWRDRIVQIHVDEKGDITLITRDGEEQFLFGKPVDIRKKFKKMEIYYTGIVNDKGEGYYKTVDIRFEEQIVCRK